MWYLFAALLTTALWFLLRVERPDELERLRRRYRRLVHLPDAEANDALARHLEALRARHPDRDERWYLDRVIADLERDRR